MSTAPDRKIIPLKLPDLGDEQPGAHFVKRAVGLTLGTLAAVAVAALLIGSLVKMDVTVKAAGSLEPVRIYPVRSNEGGPIREVLVSTGDTVKAGQVMLRLDTLALATTLAQLEAQYRAAAIEQRRSTSADPLERRTQAQRADQARGRVIAAQAALRQRMVEYDLGTNMDSLLRAYQPGRHVAIDQAVGELRSAEAEIRLSGAQTDMLDLTRFDREKLDTEMAQLQAQIRATRERMGRLEMRSPIDGVVLTEQIERLPGAYVREGETLLEVGNLQEWRVTLLVPERDVHKIRLGDSVKVEIQAFGQNERELLRGRVAHVASEPVSSEASQGAAAAAVAPRASGLYRVVAELDRSQLDEIGMDKFRRGYTVQGNVITRSGRIITLLWYYLLEKLDRDPKPVAAR